jgi:hypothetical protein
MPVLSFPRKREPRPLEHFWIPACAGMTLNRRFPTAIRAFLASDQTAPPSFWGY